MDAEDIAGRAISSRTSKTAWSWFPRRWDQACRCIIDRRRRLPSPALRGDRGI